MKFETQDLNALAAAVALIPEETIKAHAAAIRTAYAARPDKTPANAEVRIRWDIYWAAKKAAALDFGDKYLDSHLDTALRAVVGPILSR